MSTSRIIEIKNINALKVMLVNSNKGEFLFKKDGNWFYTNKSIEKSNYLFKLTKEHFQQCTCHNVENFVFNVLRVFELATSINSDYEDQTGSPLNLFVNIEDILLEDKLNSLSNSYHFKFNTSDLKYNCLFQWDIHGENIKLTFEEESLGYVYQDYDCVFKYLFNIAEKAITYEEFQQFCHQVREFQKYFYETINQQHKSLFTFPLEIALINPVNKLSDEHYEEAVRIIDLINYFDIDLGVNINNGLYDFNMHIYISYISLV